MKFLILFFVVWAGNVMAADGRYVRKQLEPDIFIPAYALPQQEKLPMPRYSQGQEETIKAVKPEPARKTDTEEIELKTVSIDSLLQSGSVDYQQKYDDYLNDLKHISQTGQLPENKKLTADLQKMTTDERIVVKKKPHQSYPKKAKFEKALYDILNSD